MGKLVWLGSFQVDNPNIPANETCFVRWRMPGVEPGPRAWNAITRGRRPRMRQSVVVGVVVLSVSFIPRHYGRALGERQDSNLHNLAASASG